MKQHMLDSREGMELLINAARVHKLVLHEYHEKLAKKHGVDSDGVIFARPIPPGYEHPFNV